MGEMTLERVELLSQGQTKQILPGKEYIHSLFHLDRPSATICVRTYHTTTESPQYNYLKPHFASDPFYQDVLTTKQMQSVALLLRMQHPQAVEMIDELLTKADFQMTFNLLDTAWGHFQNNALEHTFGLSTGKDHYQRLFETARRRHGALVDLIPPVFEEARRQNNLIHRRGQITTPEHRFFLALLLNVPDRQRLLDMVQQKFPEADPLDTVMDWMEELALTKVWGSSEANVLGITDCDEDYLFVLRCLFEGKSSAETRQFYAIELNDDLPAALEEKLTNLYQSIARSNLFSALFPNYPLTAA